MPSENGWEPPHAGADILEWVTVPGASVTVQLMKGPPSRILRAWVADWNAYIEPVRDADTAGFTPTNSVATSNHLNGTAVDIDWNSHPFHQRGTLNDAQMRTLREMLDFYEGTVFWAGDWDDPVDEMHSQMGYNTWNNPHTQDFINRKIRSDGFSTFRRGGTVTPPPPSPLSRADGYALKIIQEGRRRSITPRGIQIALATGLVESNITVYANAKVPDSMNIPHDAVGSDGFSVGIFQQQVRDTGNGWWWGDAATCMDPTSSAGLFYDRLARLDYNGPNSPGSYAQAVQQSAYPDRYDQRFGDAVALYNRLADTTPAGDDMALVPQDQWDRVYRELTQRLPSRSPLRHLGEGAVDTMAGMLLNTDGSVHVQIVELLASLGHPESLALLREVEAADPVKYPDRQQDRLIARAILAKVASAPSAAPAVLAAPAPVNSTAELAAANAEISRLREENARLQQQVAPPPEPANVPAVVDGTTGDRIGRLYDALDDLRLADALPIEARAPLAALVSVLQTKNGATLS